MHQQAYHFRSHSDLRKKIHIPDPPLRLNPLSFSARVGLREHAFHPRSLGIPEDAA